MVPGTASKAGQFQQDYTNSQGLNLSGKNLHEPKIALIMQIFGFSIFWTQNCNNEIKLAKNRITKYFCTYTLLMFASHLFVINKP